jgi:3,4-dihydroxy-2-butanone 4-phosphate synthase
MADDLSIQAANSMMQMLASRGSTELGVKLLKMQAQQEQAVVTLLANQAATVSDGGYNSSGATVAPIAQGSIDTAL